MSLLSGPYTEIRVLLKQIAKSDNIISMAMMIETCLPRSRVFAFDNKLREEMVRDLMVPIETMRSLFLLIQRFSIPFSYANTFCPKQ
jgi:hypothetical protein